MEIVGWKYIDPFKVINSVLKQKNVMCFHGRMELSLVAKTFGNESKDNINTLLYNLLKSCLEFEIHHGYFCTFQRVMDSALTLT